MFTSCNNNKCYLFNVGTGFSWSGWKSECASLGASMLCILNSEANDWIANQISLSWIGYSDLPNNDGKFEWVSGCSSSYTQDKSYSSDFVYLQAIENGVNSIGLPYYNGEWLSSSDSSSIPCSCEYSLLPTLSPSPTPLPTLSPSGDNASIIIGIVVGCAVFIIIIILILMYFFCKRTNSTIKDSPSKLNNDDISSSNQAYTDIPSTCPHPTSDDDNDNNGDGDGGYYN